MGEKLAMGLKEASAVIGLSHWTIRKYVSEGKIAAIRIGRRVLIEPSELRRFVRKAKTYSKKNG